MKYLLSSFISPKTSTKIKILHRIPAEDLLRFIRLYQYGQPARHS